MTTNDINTFLNIIESQLTENPELVHLVPHWACWLNILRPDYPLELALQELKRLLSFPEALRKDPNWIRAGKLLDWCARHQVKVLHPLHPDYPQSFFELPQPPFFLTLWGEAIWKNKQGLSVVGGREPSVESLAWMNQHLGVSLAACQMYSISGGARGIDQQAHSVSLRSHIPTVAFLPAGLQNIYPSDFMRWVQPIIESGGAVVSEFLPDQPIRTWHFERRNRLIAALGKNLFVVEGGRRSGTLLTARLALALGREICVLPSHPENRRSWGSLDLLCDGAFPLRDAQDLIHFMSAF